MVSIRSACFLALCLFSIAPESRAQVQFPVAFEASAAVLTVPERAAITSHFQAAGAAWVRQLDLSAPRSIEVTVGIDNTRPTAGGSSVTSVFVGVIGGRETFEQAAAAELRGGVDPNGATADIRITFNINYLRNELWFDPDPFARSAAVPSNRTDAMSVALHELGHAFVYNGFANLNTGQSPPTFWSTWDRFTTPGPPIYFDGVQAVVAAGMRPEQTTGNIFHWANATAMAARPSVSTPRFSLVEGVPQPHPVDCDLHSIDANSPLARALADTSLLGELMNGVVFIRGTRYKISSLDRAVLRDLNLMTTLFGNGFEAN